MASASKFSVPTAAITFIGFGGMVQTFPSGLMASGTVPISASDALFGTGAGARLQPLAQEMANG